MILYYVHKFSLNWPLLDPLGYLHCAPLNITTIGGVDRGGGGTGDEGAGSGGRGGGGQGEKGRGMGEEGAGWEIGVAG